ncbi:MAG: VOC family protein [Rhodospirillales bacterium]|nr:VOC family protein [Rhodospirillales bacterium]
MPEHGTFIWNELATTDPEKAKAFYREIAGWTYEDVDKTNPQEPAKQDAQAYTLCKVGDAMAGGMMKMEGPQWQGIPPHWLSYLCVDDVDAAVAKVEPAGGSVKLQPFDVPTVGRIAVVGDPTGAVVCLMATTEEKPS